MLLFDELSADEKTKVARINELTEQFVSADKYVFVTPLWNFSIPPQLKAYIDTICIAGKTFKYTANGAVGLLSDKKAVHIQARGGMYSEGPAKEMEFGDRYLRTISNSSGLQTSILSLWKGWLKCRIKLRRSKRRQFYRRGKLQVPLQKNPFECNEGREVLSGASFALDECPEQKKSE